MLTPTFIQCFHYAEKPSNSDELIKTIEEGALSEDQNFSLLAGRLGWPRMLRWLARPVPQRRESWVGRHRNPARH